MHTRTGLPGRGSSVGMGSASGTCVGSGDLRRTPRCKGVAGAEGAGGAGEGGPWMAVSVLCHARLFLSSGSLWDCGTVGWLRTGPGSQGGCWAPGRMLCTELRLEPSEMPTAHARLPSKAERFWSSRLCQTCRGC